MPDGLNRPDGRWARILHALEQRPLSFGALVTRARSRAFTSSEDRAKCRRAIFEMRRQGLVAGHWGLLRITDHGRTSFARVLTEAPPQ